MSTEYLIATNEQLTKQNDQLKNENDNLKKLLVESSELVKSLGGNPLNGDRAEIKIFKFLSKPEIQKILNEGSQDD